MRSVPLPTFGDMNAASRAVQTYLEPTPLVQMNASWWLKLESQQPIGSFKIRGAIAALDRLKKGTKVVTASAGNHALGVAWAAAQTGNEAMIVVPENASSRKLDLLQEMDAHIILHGDSFEEAERKAMSMQSDSCIYISAYNDPHVIAGQATIVDELCGQLPGDFTVVAPVGGGGLAAGIALGASYENYRSIRVIGVEAEHSPAVSAALAAGHTVEVLISDTLADGLAGNLEPGSITVSLLARYGVQMVRVSEAEIAWAMRNLYVEHDIVAEGAAAVSWAAMNRLDLPGPVVGIISGRNVTEATLRRILEGDLA